MAWGSPNTKTDLYEGSPKIAQMFVEETWTNPILIQYFTAEFGSIRERAAY